MSYQKQLELEELYSKDQVKSWIRNNVDTKSTEFKRAMETISSHINNSSDFYVSKKIRYIVLKRFDVFDITMEVFTSVLLLGKTPLQGVATNIGLNFYDDYLNAVKTGAELLAICEDVGLYEIQHASYAEENITTVIPLFEVDDEVKELIHRTQYLPPMLCEPRKWITNKDGGYLLGKDNCVLGIYSKDDTTPKDLEALNKLQSIKWSLNLHMLEEDETFKYASEDEYVNAYLKEFGNVDEYEISLARTAYHKMREEHVNRVIQSKRIYNDMISQGNNEFYFSWKYDNRGRVYSQGYDINLQGNEYKKAILEFSTAEVLTGVQYD